MGSGTDVPESFHRVQWTRLPGGETPPEFVARITLLAVASASTHCWGVRPSAELAPDVARPSLVGREACVHAALALRDSRGVGRGGARVAASRSAVEPRTRAPGAPAAGGEIAEAPPVTTPTAPTSATFSPPPHSIAVLPFINMSGDAKQDYFSDGIAEELLIHFRV